MSRFETPDQRLRRISQHLIRGQNEQKKLRNQAAKLSLERQQRQEDARQRPVPATQAQRDQAATARINARPDPYAEFRNLGRGTAVATPTPTPPAPTADVEGDRQRALASLAQDFVATSEPNRAYYGNPRFPEYTDFVNKYRQRQSAQAQPLPSIEQAPETPPPGTQTIPISPEEGAALGNRADLGPIRQLQGPEVPQFAEEVTRRPNLTPPGVAPAARLLTQPPNYIPGFQRGLEEIERIPYAGESLRRAAEFQTSPLGIGIGAVAPALAAGTLGGQVVGETAGTALEQELGAPPATSDILGLAGALAGPAAAPLAEAGIRAGAENLAARTERAGGLGGLVAEETGGSRFGMEIPEQGFIREPRPVEPPWKQAAAKFATALEATPELRAGQETARTAERGERISRYHATLGEELAKGTPPQEALRIAQGELRGEMTFAEFRPGEQLLTPEEGQQLWQRAAEWTPPEGFPFRKPRLAEAMRKVFVEGKLPQENEVTLLREVFGPELALAVEKKAAQGEAGWNLFLDAAGIPKAFLSSFDLSYPGRQGILTAVRHPKEFFGNFGNMIKAFRSEEGAARVMASITDDPAKFTMTTADGGTTKVPFGEIVTENMPGVIRTLEAPVSAREQRVLRAWLGKIPGIAHSQRAFVTYGNKLRADIAKYWLGVAEHGGPMFTSGRPITPERAKAIGNLTQRLTGQGTFGTGAGRITDGIAALGWSPFYRIAPLQVVASLAHPDPLVRRAAAENLIGFVGAGTALLAGLKISGSADVETDPRSSDFGKIKVGKERINFWGTNQLLARSIAQVIEGERKSLDSGLVFPAKEEETIKSYLRSGLAPEWSLIWDALEGKTGLGREVDFTSLQGLQRESLERLVPLVFQDIVKASREEGLRGGLSAAPLSTFGVGVQAFGPNPRIELAPKFKDSVSERDLAWAEDLLYYTELERAAMRERGIDTENIPFVVSLALAGKKVGADDNVIKWATLIRPGSKTRDIYTGKAEANLEEQRQRILEGVR